MSYTKFSHRGRSTYPLDYAAVIFGFHGDLAVIVIPAVLLHAHMQLLEESLALLGLAIDVFLGHRGIFGPPEEEVAELLLQVHIGDRH